MNRARNYRQTTSELKHYITIAREVLSGSIMENVSRRDELANVCKLSSVCCAVLFFAV
jgi:hypothetical protein